MVDTPRQPSHRSRRDPAPKIIFVDQEPKISKAQATLRQKVGFGGIDPTGIAAAEKRLIEAKAMFPKMAASDIETIGYALQQLLHAPRARQWLERIQWSAVELRANSAMFQYPLVSAVAASLCRYLDHVGIDDPLSAKGHKLLSLHLQTLQLALDEGARAITPHDEVNVLSGLIKAVDKLIG